MKLARIFVIFALVVSGRSSSAADEALLTKFNSQLEYAMPNSAWAADVRARMVDWARTLQAAAPETVDNRFWTASPGKALIAKAEARADAVYEMLETGRALFDTDHLAIDQQRELTAAVISQIAHLYADLSQYKGSPQWQIFSGVKDYAILSTFPGVMFGMGYPLTMRGLGYLPTRELNQAAFNFAGQTGLSIAAASVVLVVALAPRIRPIRARILREEGGRQYRRDVRSAETVFWARLRSRLAAHETLRQLLPSDPDAPLGPMLINRLSVLGDGIGAACESLLGAADGEQRSQWTRETFDREANLRAEWIAP